MFTENTVKLFFNFSIQQATAASNVCHVSLHKI